MYKASKLDETLDKVYGDLEIIWSKIERCANHIELLALIAEEKELKAKYFEIEEAIAMEGKK